MWRPFRSNPPPRLPANPPFPFSLPALFPAARRVDESTETSRIQSLACDAGAASVIPSLVAAMLAAVHCFLLRATAHCKSLTPVALYELDLDVLQLAFQFRPVIYSECPPIFTTIPVHGCCCWAKWKQVRSQ